MNELASLGVILLLALLASHAVQFARIPEVTGYILAGIVLGPSVLGWVSHENLAALHVLSEVTLGLILLSVGAVFRFDLLARFGRRIVLLTLAESLLAGLLVAAGGLFMGQPWQVALLLGTVAMETAPASTLMVLRECHSEGPLTDTILGIIAVNNLLCLTTFSVMTSALELSSGTGGVGILAALWGVVHSLTWQLAGSAALGFLVGLLLACWARTVAEHGEMLMLLAGAVLLCLGAARFLGLSPLVASLAVGGTLVNLAGPYRRVFETLTHSDPPLYAVFFVMAGADLDVSLISTMGALGAYYLLARGSGKFIGARLGARKLGMNPLVQRFLGFGLLAHAGLAIGLTLTISQRFPEYAPAVTTVVLSCVVIYEIIGPVGAKFAIVRSGESRVRAHAPAVPGYREFVL